MTFALPKTQPFKWIRLFGRLSFAVSTAVIAVAAIVGSGVLADNEQGTPAEPSPAISAGVPYVPLVSYPPMTYFLVASEAQHDLVVAQQTEIANSQSDSQDHWFGVLVAGTPELEGEAWDMLKSIQVEISRCCPTSILQITDLRTK